MIKRLGFYISDGFDPYINLAREKCLFDMIEPDVCTLYLWQNQNTVVIGKNQNALAECRTELLQSEGGHLARRLSGGGAVFHDLGNLNFTFLCSADSFDVAKQLDVIAYACRLAGIEVKPSGRNDLLADGRKFSGNAFYSVGENKCHHGTVLIASDMGRLSNYLTVSARGLCIYSKRSASLRNDRKLARDVVDFLVRDEAEAEVAEVVENRSATR